MQKVPIWSNKGRGTLLTIFRPPRIFQSPPLIIFYTHSQPPCLLDSFRLFGTIEYGLKGKVALLKERQN